MPALALRLHNADVGFYTAIPTLPAAHALGNRARSHDEPGPSHLRPTSLGPSWHLDHDITQVAVHACLGDSVPLVCPLAGLLVGPGYEELVPDSRC
jgi:hypothetical protein